MKECRGEREADRQDRQTEIERKKLIPNHCARALFSFGKDELSLCNLPTAFCAQCTPGM